MAERKVDRFRPNLILGLSSKVETVISGCYATFIGSNRSLVRSPLAGYLGGSVARYVKVKEAEKSLMSAQNSSFEVRRRAGRAVERKAAVRTARRPVHVAQRASMERACWASSVGDCGYTRLQRGARFQVFSYGPGDAVARDDLRARSENAPKDRCRDRIWAR